MSAPLAGKHCLVAGGVHQLTGVMLKYLQQAGAATSIAFDPLEGSQAIALVSDTQVDVARMRALDFSSARMLQSQVMSFEPLDTLIWLPRWYGLSAFLESSSADWQQALERNFEQVVYTLQAVTRLFIAQSQGGRIIIVSLLPAQHPHPDSSVLAMSLSALQTLSLRAAHELRSHHITVNTVVAGWSQSDWSYPVTEVFDPSPQGLATNIAAACAFLASDSASHMTGSSLTVDDGYRLHMRTRSTLDQNLSKVTSPVRA